MKVIVFVNTSWNIYNFRAGLVRALQKSGHEIHALAPEDNYSVHLTAMGCIYHPIKMKNTGENPLDDINLIRSIYHLFKKIKPHLVLNYTIKPNIYGALVAKWLEIPSVCTISGLGTVFLTKSKSGKIARFLYRKAFKHPKKIFFQNPSDLDLFKKTRLITRNNFQLIPGSGVDTKRFSPGEPMDRTPFKFLMMARLIEEKGIKEYLTAATILRDQGSTARCQLIGAAEPDHKRGITVREIENSQVEYLGETSDVRQYIDEAHAIVLPSYREGLSKSLLEAAAMAKPIIASDVPGCVEVVKDQINGLLCKPRNAKDLAGKMREMEGFSLGQLRQMGRSGRKMVVENYAEEKVINEYLNTIANILKIGH